MKPLEEQINELVGQIDGLERAGTEELHRREREKDKDKVAMLEAKVKKLEADRKAAERVKCGLTCLPLYLKEPTLGERIWNYFKLTSAALVLASALTAGGYGCYRGYVWLTTPLPLDVRVSRALEKLPSVDEQHTYKKYITRRDLEDLDNDVKRDILEKHYVFLDINSSSELRSTEQYGVRHLIISEILLNDFVAARESGHLKDVSYLIIGGSIISDKFDDDTKKKLKGISIDYRPSAMQRLAKRLVE